LERSGNAGARGEDGPGFRCRSIRATCLSSPAWMNSGRVAINTPEKRVTDHFLCGICGKEHAGVPTDHAYKLPDIVWAIPEPERSARAKFSSDLCQLGERYFIRGVLHVPFSEAEGDFGWGVWAEVEWPVFERYLKLYDEDGSTEPAQYSSGGGRLA
jgi:ribosomal protein L34E